MVPPPGSTSRGVDGSCGRAAANRAGSVDQRDTDGMLRTCPRAGARPLSRVRAGLTHPLGLLYRETPKGGARSAAAPRREGRHRVDSGTDKLIVAVESGIGRVTFNNPAKHNALSVEMLAQLPPVLSALQDDPDVRVVVVTGAGERAFASGADISEFGEQRTSPEARAGYDRHMAEAARAWAALDKP